MPIGVQLIFLLIIATSIGGLIFIVYNLIKQHSRSFSKFPKSEPAVLTEADLNKDPKDLRHKMEKVWLRVDGLNHPVTGIRLDIDHRKEIQADLDEYQRNMKPFVVVTANNLLMPRHDFAHVGYYLQGEIYDLDGKHLYASKRWAKDLDKHLPYPKKGLSKLWEAIKQRIPFMTKVFSTLVLLAVLAPAYADEPTSLAKNEPAPYSGILMPVDDLKTIKKDLIDLDAIKHQVDLYKQNEAILTQQVTVWKDQSTALSQQLTEEKNSIWGKVGAFALGAGITVLLTFAVNGASK